MTLWIYRWDERYNEVDQTIQLNKPCHTKPKPERHMSPRDTVERSGSRHP